MAEKGKYYINVQGNLIEVSQEIYQAYHSMERHRKTLDEKDRRNRRVLYSALDTEEMLGEEMLIDRTAPSIEEIVVSRLLYEKLHQCLELLPKGERKLIQALYFEGISERQLSKRIKIPHMTIHDRKAKALEKLRKWMEK